MGLGNLAEDDVMITLLNDGGHAAFNSARSINKDRGASFSFAVGLLAELPVSDVRRTKEREGEILLVLAQHIECQHPCVLEDMSRMDADRERPEIPAPIGAGSPQGEAHQVLKPRALRD
jgi:hypothetical protein